jgi:hypothetical protein
VGKEFASSLLARASKFGRKGPSWTLTAIAPSFPLPILSVCREAWGSSTLDSSRRWFRRGKNPQCTLAHGGSQPQGVGRSVSVGNWGRVKQASPEVARGSERPLAPSGGQKPRRVRGAGRAATTDTTPPHPRPLPACGPGLSPPPIPLPRRLDPGRGCHGGTPGPRAAARLRASTGLCPAQQFSGGSTRGPISRRLFPGDGGRGGLHRPLPRAPARPRLWFGCGNSACPGCDVAAARSSERARRDKRWPQRPLGSAAPRVGDVPYPGFSSHNCKSRPRRRLKSKSSTKSLAKEHWVSVGLTWSGV